MTKREQMLAIGFGAVLIGGGAFVGLTHLKNWKQRVDQRFAELTQRESEANQLLAEQDRWEQRSAWLAEKQPVYTSRSESDVKLLDFLRQTSTSNAVTIDGLQPQEPTQLGDLTAATAALQAKGDLAAVLKWLHAIQEPTAFISIPAFTMIPNEEDTSQVIVNMTIQKWFRVPPPA